MFGQIIVNDQYVLSILHPFFSDRTSGIRCDILQRSKFTGSGCYNGCIIHGSVFFQCLYDIGNGRCFLTDRYINTFYILTLLVDDRVNRDRCLTGLTVSDDQLTLSSSDRHHGVNCLDTCLKRGIYALSVDNSGSYSFDLTEFPA